MRVEAAPRRGCKPLPESVRRYRRRKRAQLREWSRLGGLAKAEKHPRMCRTPGCCTPSGGSDYCAECLADRALRRQAAEAARLDLPRIRREIGAQIAWMERKGLLPPERPEGWPCQGGTV
jgi:hypothetical protein